MSEFMPIMTDVNAFFDARIGVTSTVWENQTGDIDFQLFNPIQNTDGVEVVGSETSYGKFTKPYVSGSSKTNYCVFKNVGGVYADWKTIVGNESGTYTCSTIAMDKNGNLAFTRNNILQSTYKCSDWHVVAWVSDASSQTTKLWIDGTYIGSATRMQGWADDTYLCRGSTWSFEDNNTVFRAIAIADSAHSDDDVVTNSNWLYENYIGGKIEKTPVYNFDGKIHGDDSWVDTINSKNMTIGKGSFVWEDDCLVLSKNTNYFRLPTDFGSYGTFEVLVKIDESFTPVSKNNWYQASCIFGCELSGGQQDWAIVIDKDGYFAIGHGFSTITSTDIKANDGLWHTLAMIVGSSDMKLYIDGVLKQSVNITMSGTLISTFGVGWNNVDANTSITGHIGTVKVWNSSLTEEEVLNSYNDSVNWLNGADGGDEGDGQTPLRKYLIRSDSLMFTIIDGVLTPLDEFDMNSSIFENQGFDKLPDGSLLLELLNPEILYWQNNLVQDDLPVLKATLTATPIPQTVVTNQIDLSHPTIKGIQCVTTECTGNPLFACSFDDGVTWKVHNGSGWSNMVGSAGMTKAVLEAITTEQWSQALEGLSSFMLWFVLNTTEDTVTNVIIDYINEGE